MRTNVGTDGYAVMWCAEHGITSLFVRRFLMTSEGKTGNELKEELINANSNMALVSALLLGVTMSWAFGSTNTCFCDKFTGKNCFCSAGFDRETP